MDIFKDTNIKMLDIETTGLNPQLDSIIELGVIELQDGEIIREHSRLFGGGSSSPSLVKIHGIKDEQRVGLDRFELCADRIAAYLSNTILAGYNIKKFDLPMIECKLKSVGVVLTNYKTLDVYNVVRRYKMGTVDNKLKTLCDKFEITHGGHRGLEDSRCTWELLKRLILEFNIKELRELMK